MLVDYSYFTGILSVGLSPDTGADSVTKDAERSILESYIEVYEKDYLDRILGEDACGDFIAYLSQDIPVEKWEKLKALLKVPYSPVACYVYVHYVGECGKSVTRSGVTVSSADDGLAQPDYLQIRAWNMMARQNRRVYELVCGGDYGEIPFDPYLLETINEFGL